MTDDEINEKDKSKMESLEKSLYSRSSDQVAERERRNLKQRDYGVKDEWSEITEEDTAMKTRRPFAKMILIGAIAFFALSTVFSSYFFFRGEDISPDNVVISVQGPTLIGGGEELSLQITIRNTNPVPIEAADLIIEYPRGTHSAANIDQELPRYRESLGTINPGEEVRKTVEAVLFGEENSIKNIDISVEYDVRGSNATFFSNYVYELALSSSPLSLVIESNSEAISGQEINFVAKIKSNSSSVIRDVMLRAEYPPGFEFGEASPEPVFAKKTWYLGDIAPEAEEEILISGILSGQDGEERVFRFAAGIQSESDENSIGAEFVNVPESLFIKRPFITATLTLNDQTRDTVAAPSGSEVKGKLTWTNNLPTQIFDGEIEIEFSGAAVDETTIEGVNGFYRSIDNKLIWTRDTLASLGTIPSGESGTVDFSFDSFGFSSGIPLRNPEIKLDVNVRGKRLSDGNVPEFVDSTLSKKVRVSSDLVLTSKVLHFTGPFQNTGPMPPKIEQETTYTVVLTVLNSSNDVANTRVTTTLPPYVEWLGVISPLTESVTYTAVGERVIWDLGEVKAGTGTTLPPRELSFQVTLLPSISQIGSTPTLVAEQTLVGGDRFTEVELTSQRGELDIDLSEVGFVPKEHRKIVQ